MRRTDFGIVPEIIADVARAEIMPRFNRLGAGSVHEKTSAFDIVTEADEAAERGISARLRHAFPHAAMIGEEAAARDPGLIGQISTADLAFLIDPIDGTKNFASGVPAFGVMVAATVKGQIVFGAIHDPVSGVTVLAERGAGAWQRTPGLPSQPLRVADAVPLAQMQGVVGTNFLPEPLRSTVAGNLSRLGVTFWLRCAAQEYRLAAAGHCHLLFYNKLMPWDHAAGWLIHQEAGGFSAHFDASPYLPVHTSGGLLCTPDRDSWHQVHAALFGTDKAGVSRK